MEKVIWNHNGFNQTIGILFSFLEMFFYLVKLTFFFASVRTCVP